VDSTKEAAVELFYKWQATPQITLQPDLQWILRPGGAGPHALLFGMRVAYQF
jgi:carbohydrate-selective porin OprB